MKQSTGKTHGDRAVVEVLLPCGAAERTRVVGINSKRHGSASISGNPMLGRSENNFLPTSLRINHMTVVDYDRDIDTPHHHWVIPRREGTRAGRMVMASGCPVSAANRSTV